jgi:hypothetical protein
MTVMIDGEPRYTLAELEKEFAWIPWSRLQALHLAKRFTG